MSWQDHLLQLEDARAHCLFRERRALSRRLARRQCCHRNRCTRSERVVIIAAVHMRSRRNRLCQSLTVRKRRLIDLRMAAPPSLVRVETPPPLHARAVPPLVPKPASDQQHFAPLREKARIAVRIVDGNAQSQCSATAYGEYGAATNATRGRRKLKRSQEHADAAPASIALSSSAATTQSVYCYAVSSRVAQV